MITQHHNNEVIADEWVAETLLFKRWSAMKREILLHKWYESEKAGHDVGWERAATNWMIHYSQMFRFSSVKDNSRKA